MTKIVSFSDKNKVVPTICLMIAMYSVMPHSAISKISLNKDEPLSPGVWGWGVQNIKVTIPSKMLMIITSYFTHGM